MIPKIGNDLRIPIMAQIHITSFFHKGGVLELHTFYTFMHSCPLEITISFLCIFFYLSRILVYSPTNKSSSSTAYHLTYRTKNTSYCTPTRLAYLGSQIEPPSFPKSLCSTILESFYLIGITQWFKCQI